MAIKKTGGKIEFVLASEGKVEQPKRTLINSINAGAMMANDSANGGAPKNLVLPKPTKVPPKPIQAKE